MDDASVLDRKRLGVLGLLPATQSVSGGKAMESPAASGIAPGFPYPIDSHRFEDVSRQYYLTNVGGSGRTNRSRSTAIVRSPIITIPSVLIRKTSSSG